MKTDTSNKIIKYIQDKQQLTAKELIDYLEISKQALYKHLSRLLAKGKIIKIGKPPKVFYLIKDSPFPKPASSYTIKKEIRNIVQERFLIITPLGEEEAGWPGFVYWCQKNKLNIEKAAGEYIRTLKKYDAFKRQGLVNGLNKIKNTFKKAYLSNVYYLDFYSIERFGKTKLGQFLLCAKQSQNKRLIKILVKKIEPQIKKLIKQKKIDGVGFIPPTVKREIQFMKEMQRNLRLKIKIISIVKVKTPLIVPQKTLNKLEDRIINAQNTIIVDEPGTYKNILLIDDAVGSGATFNETAKQIKDKKISRQVFGLSITGSFKGFDVISEV